MDWPRIAVVAGGIALAVLCLGLAPWLNGWSLFAFPIGTFILALVLPLALVALVLAWVTRMGARQ